MESVARSGDPSHPPRRFKLTLAYDGTGFHGWQKQHPPDAEPLRTVQGVVEGAVRSLVRQPIELTGASRTDAGVHAEGQVAAFTACTAIPLDRLAKAINARLPADVEVRGAEIVPDDFEPIAGAVRKRYRYRIWNTTQRPLGLRHLVYHGWAELDLARMQDAAHRLVGTHDFEGLAAAGHGRTSTVRTIFACAVEARPTARPTALRRGLPRDVYIYVEGDGFLYNMVRILAGTLYEVGRGRFEPSQVDAILATADRRLAGPTLPPQGLTLEWVAYGEGTKGRRKGGRDEGTEGGRDEGTEGGRDEGTEGRRDGGAKSERDEGTEGRSDEGGEPHATCVPSSLRPLVPPLRILHVITRLILGGAQQNTLLCCKAQVAAGHDVTLAYGPIYGPEGSLLPQARATGATLLEVPTLERELRPLDDARAYFALRRLIRDGRFDLVHTHSSKAGILGRAAAWAPGKVHRPGVVHTVHGLPFHPHQSRLKHSLYVRLERWAARRCDALIALTPAMVDAFVEHRIAPRDKFTIIPSGIDTGKFQPPEAHGVTPWASGASVGLVARLDPLKGHMDLLAAWPGIVQRHPDARLLFIGDGELRDTLAADPRVQQHHVHLRGLVPTDAMPEVYRSLDVVVLPSYQEGQSRVLAEALLSGCGIVAYDVGGIPSLCRDGETGRLVPVGDTEALADAVIDLLDHPRKRRQFAAAGAKLVREHFSAQAMVREVERVYAESAEGIGNREQVGRKQRR